MNFTKFMLGVATLMTCMNIFSQITISQNSFIGRPFSMDMAREVMAEENAWSYMQDNTNWFGTVQIITQYNHSTNAQSLGALPFWNNTNEMSIGRNSYGSTAYYDVDAYQFGLGDTINTGLMSLSPQFYSAGINFFLFAAPHEKKPGFFGKINIPCGATGMNPNFQEINQIIGQTYAQGEMNSAGTHSSGALTFPIYANITQAFTGTAVAGSPNGSVFQGLSYGKINGSQTSLVRFGDIDGALGYNFLANEKSHIGIAVRLSAPLGNKPTAVYILEPIWGNGGHWGVGGEVMGHTIVWQGHYNNTIQFWFDAQAMHLFKAMHIRSFDLTANGPGSKYLLVKDLGASGSDAQQLIQPFINISTIRTFSTVGMVFDIALLLQANYGNWQFGIGYNFAGKSSESLTLLGTVPTGRYGILGQQLNESGGTASKLIDPTAQMNKPMPSAQGSGVTGSYFLNIQGNSALNVTGEKLQGGCSSKFFVQSVYRWMNTDYCPLIAVQTSVEFSNSNNNALSQWGIGLRGGFSF